MPKRGSNFIPLVLDTRLLVAVNGKASSKKQLNATYIMSVLVEHCRTDLEPQAYKQLKQRYSKTVYQQKQEKMAKEKEKLEREEEKLALKKKELKLKEQTAKGYTEQTNYAIEKPKQARIEELEEMKTAMEEQIKLAKGSKSKSRIPKLQEQLAEINEELKQLDTA